MNTKPRADLHDRMNAESFYDERYDQGYMDDWPEVKKERIRDIIRSLSLPATGKALDFGCGNGVFTSIIKEVLPAWEVYGSEISKVAVVNAKKRYSNCLFLHADDPLIKNLRFDFLFSHHVLEHVSDINETAGEIDLMLAPSAWQLHVLPCGNPGSLEYQICKMRKNGIDPAAGNRFFFEEEGHLRRLTSVELANIFAPYKFKYHSGWFANQYYGAIDWISKWDEDFINMLTDVSQVSEPADKKTIVSLRKQILRIRFIKQHALFFQNDAKGFVRISNRGKRALFQLLYQPFLRKLRYEWEKRSSEPNGSEMFVALHR